MTSAKPLPTEESVLQSLQRGPMQPRAFALDRVLRLMNQCETCTGYGDPETVRIFRGVARRISEAVYGDIGSRIKPEP